MQQDLLPFFKTLQQGIASLSRNPGASEEAALQLAASGKVVDFLLVRHTQLDALKAEAYNDVCNLLPEIKKTLVDTGMPTDLVESTEKMAEGGNPDVFEQFLERLQDVGKQLFAPEKKETLLLARRLANIEGNYQEKFRRAVDAMSEETAGLNPSAATNTRDYDREALVKFIRESFPGERDLKVEDIDFIMGGSSKITMSIDVSGVKSIPRQLIMRADASGMFGGADAIQEYRLFRVLHENGVCIPRPLVAEESGNVFGSPFMLMERRPGRTLCMGFEPPLQPNEQACESVAKGLAHLHSIAAEKFENVVKSKYQSNSEKILSWLDEGFNAWSPLDMPSPSVLTALEWLKANVAVMDRGPRTLVHGDYSLHNMLVHDDRLSAILDWEFADFGNPCYDLGYFYYMSTGLSSWEHFLSCYEKESGLSLDEKQLDYCCLLAATRLGIMNMQAISLFNQAVNTGLVFSIVISHDYYGQTITRINQWLDKVIK